jgi:hypothetical protein
MAAESMSSGFNELSVEFRVKIWQIAAKEPRIVIVPAYDGDSLINSQLESYIRRPAVLDVCKEPRYEGPKEDFTPLRTRVRRGQKILANLDRDTVCFLGLCDHEMSVISRVLLMLQLALGDAGEAARVRHVIVDHLRCGPDDKEIFEKMRYYEEFAEDFICLKFLTYNVLDTKTASPNHGMEEHY